MGQTAVRGNQVPQGGAMNPVTKGVIAGGMNLPDTQLLQQAANAFHEASEQNFLVLDTQTLTPGGQTLIKLQNVGLGESMEFWVEGTATFDNGNVAAQTLSLGADFPYSILNNIQTQFNGKVMLNNLSGYELLTVMAKRNPKNQFMFSNGQHLTATGVGGTTVTNAVRLDKNIAYCYLVRPSGDAVSELNYGAGLTGALSATLKASTTGIQIKFGFYLQLPFTLREDIPAGLLPMQNNSIYATIRLQTANLYGATADFPFYGGTTVSLASSSLTVEPTYNFWGIPDNPALYSWFVNNSYLLISQPKNSFTNTGSKALRFNFPNNYYLMAALFTVRDSSQVLVDVRNKINNPYLVYNGTISVDLTGIKTRMARDMFQAGRVLPPGQFIFDGTSGVSRDVNSMDTSRWLNMYDANNPTYFADVDASIGVPGSFDVLLEQFVPNYVKVL